MSGQLQRRGILLARCLIWPLSFLLVFVFALWSNHRSGAWNGANLSSSLDQLIEGWGWSDAGSYLNLGRALAQLGGVPEDLAWIVVLWPAGMPTVYRIAVRLSDLSFPILLSVQIIVGFVWFVALSLVRSLLLRLMSNRIIPDIVMTVFLLSSFFRDSMLGVLAIYSDSLTLALLVAFVGFLVFAAIPGNSPEIHLFRVTRSNLRRWVFAILAGLSLAGAALLRSQYALVKDLLLIIMVLLGVMTLVAGLMQVFLRQRLMNGGGQVVQIAELNGPSARSLPVSLFTSLALRARRLFLFPTVVRMFLAVLLCLGAFSVVLDRYLDWRQERIVDVPWDPAGARTLSNTSASAWRAVWYSEEMLADFIALGGQGTACRIAPDTCAEIHDLEISSGDPFNIYSNVPLSSGDYQRLATELLRERPLDWVSDKTPYFFDYATMKLGVTRADPRSSLDLLWSCVIAIGGLVVISRSAFTRRSLTCLGALTAAWVVVLGVAIAPSFVAHFEVRYLASMFFTEQLLKSILLGSSLWFVGHLIGGRIRGTRARPSFLGNERTPTVASALKIEEMRTP